MKGVLKALGLGAACVLACSLPMLLSMAGLAGFGLGAGTWAVLALIGAGLIVGLIFQRKHAKAPSCAIDGSCGCKD